jgi:hypothetical protein
MNTIEKYINSEKLKISYLQSGDIAKISYDNTMLNMYNPPKRAKINDVITFTDILDS